MNQELINRIEISKYKEKDPQLFPQYVQRIKGNMSSAEFADKLGVNPSTVSRLLSEKYTSTVSESLIKSLAALLTPEMGISYEMLLDANGMRFSNQRDLLRSRMMFRRTLEETVTNILVTAVANNSEKYSRFSGNKRLPLKGNYTIFPDLILEVEEVINEKLPKNRMWAFDYLTSGSAPTKDDRDYQRSSMRIIQRLSAMVLQYVQYDEAVYEHDYQYHEVPIKYSVVLNDEGEFEAVRASLQEIKTPMPASIILVDTGDKTIKREFGLMGLDGRRHETFFKGSEAVEGQTKEISKEEMLKFLEDELENSLESEVDD